MDIPNASPQLYNEDLAPAKERRWGAFSIFNVWTSDVHSLWGYYLAASLFLLFHQSTHVLGHSGLEVICYLVVWALQLLIIQHGMETVRKFNDWAGPAVWVMMLILAIGLVVKAGGFSFSHTIPMDVLLEKT